MASTKFYLDCRRAKPGLPSVLKIAIGHGNKTSYVSLDAKLLPNQWDSIKEKVKEHPDKQILNAYIYEIKQNVDAQIIFLTREQKIKSIRLRKHRQRKSVAVLGRTPLRNELNLLAVGIFIVVDNALAKEIHGLQTALVDIVDEIRPARTST